MLDVQAGLILELISLSYSSADDAAPSMKLPSVEAHNPARDSRLHLLPTAAQLFLATRSVVRIAGAGVVVGTTAFISVYA